MHLGRWIVGPKMSLADFGSENVIQPDMGIISLGPRDPSR